MMRLLREKSITRPQFILILVLVAAVSVMGGAAAVLKTGVYHGLVSGISMEKTLAEGDRLLKINPNLRGIKRGDMVSIYGHLDGERANFLKRVIAMPFETIRIEGNNVYINGVLLEEPYAYYSRQSEDNLVLTLSKDEYFVMGDNRIESLDSRRAGAIPKDIIVSVVFKIRKSYK